ncbi:hypothetical protein AAFF_G00346850 [Aldrovandia affinis]|uniref:Uncharacterized protein n=1 Tax=Aldrovandia affinis TaxID=143900 RepID=A0AAD7SJJ2_9TELE|nr:hypothetical protein AAFF_G00346850 [Aldrovandia affinis]
MSSSRQITTGGPPISSATTNKLSFTTLGTLTPITSTRTTRPISSSQTTPAVTTKGPAVTAATSTLTNTSPEGTSSQITTSKRSTVKLSNTPTLSVTSAHRTTQKSTTASFTVCEGSRVTDIRLDRVSSKEIDVSWSGDNLRPEYNVKLKQGSNSIEQVETENKAQFKDLLPGVTYTLTIEYLSCSTMEEITRNITTAANIFESSTRIPGREFDPDYKNQSSQQFKIFAAYFKEEVKANVPSDYQDLINANDMRVVVTEIRRGSVIVNFDLVTSVRIELVTSSVEKNIINALNMSALGVDLNQTTVREADICERGDHMCSENGNCIRDGPSYVCECRAAFTDQNPSVPGTDCQKDALTTTSPTSHQTTDNGNDNCGGMCSSLAECTLIGPGSYGCRCFAGLIDENTLNPGKLCRDPVHCFGEDTNLCLSGNKCLLSRAVCSLKNLFKSTVELKSWEFIPAYYNTKSQDWIIISTNFTITVVNRMRSVLSDKSFDLSIVGFQRGSVVARLVFGFNGDITQDTKTLETALQDVVRANLDKSALVTVEELSLGENNSGRGWRVATIILGVLLGFILLLILVAGVTFALRRRVNLSTSYKVQQTAYDGHIVPTGTLGNYIYQDV